MRVSSLIYHTSTFHEVLPSHLPYTNLPWELTLRMSHHTLALVTIYCILSQGLQIFNIFVSIFSSMWCKLHISVLGYRMYEKAYLWSAFFSCIFLPAQLVFRFWECHQTQLLSPDKSEILKTSYKKMGFDSSQTGLPNYMYYKIVWTFEGHIQEIYNLLFGTAVSVRGEQKLHSAEFWGLGDVPPPPIPWKNADHRPVYQALCRKCEIIPGV